MLTGIVTARGRELHPYAPENVVPQARSHPLGALPRGLRPARTVPADHSGPIAQNQSSEAFPWDGAPRYLLRDRDGVYGDEFTARVRAMGMVTNKQYTAFLTELNTAKSTRGDIEEQIIQEMERIEQLDAELATLAEQTTERTKVCDVARDQLEERQVEIGERLAELETERSQAAAGVPGQHLAVFEELAANYEGEAMAPVDEIDRRHRDYACGACHMTVPFEHIAVLASAAESLVRCTACGRIIFLQEEIRGALAKK